MTGEEHAILEAIRSTEPIKTLIISGFPGVGKSYFTKNNPSSIDSDSSQFSWIEKGVRHPDWPQNYMTHINVNIGKVKYILVSTHTEVREALDNAGLEYIIVHPSKDLKEEYLQRYIDRGSPQAFVDLMDTNWDNFIDGLDESEVLRVEMMGDHQYLSEVTGLERFREQLGN